MKYQCTTGIGASAKDQSKRGNGFKDITGRKFGRLTVVGFAGHDKHRKILWRCICECGNETAAVGFKLREGLTRSCGCLHREQMMERNRRKATGITRYPEYSLWRAMIKRCTNPKADNFGHYGGRGITVCDRWRYGEGGKSGLECFIDDVVVTRPSLGHTLDRYPDQNGNYEPGNVRWATRSEQNRNLRTNRIVEFCGQEMSLAEAAERAGINYATAKSRLDRGWSVGRALGGLSDGEAQ